VQQFLACGLERHETVFLGERAAVVEHRNADSLGTLQRLRSNADDAAPRREDG
jgi:hypothetical protein